MRLVLDEVDQAADEIRRGSLLQIGCSVLIASKQGEMQRTSRASFCNLLMAGTKVASLRLTEGLMLGSLPSCMCITTARGESFRRSAVARISVIVYVQVRQTTNIGGYFSGEKRDQQMRTFSPIPRAGTLITLLKAGTKWGLSMSWR